MNHEAWFALPAAGVALAATLFDLDRLFYNPDQSSNRMKLRVLRWVFVLTNAALAAVVFFFLRNAETFESWNSWLFALTVGAGYLALARLKFTTFSFQGKDVPFGLEALYDSGKQYLFRRINAVVKTDKNQRAQALAVSLDADELAARVRTDINNDNLLSPEDKKLRLAWLLSTKRDADASDAEKRAVFASYLVSGSHI